MHTVPSVQDLDAKIEDNIKLASLRSLLIFRKRLGMSFEAAASVLCPWSSGLVVHFTFSCSTHVGRRKLHLNVNTPSCKDIQSAMHFRKRLLESVEQGGDAYDTLNGLTRQLAACRGQARRLGVVHLAHVATQELQRRRDRILAEARSSRVKRRIRCKMTPFLRRWRLLASKLSSRP